MPRKRFRPLKMNVVATRPQRRRLNGRELDFLLLAGCSCLLTVLYHPVSDAFQSFSAQNSAQGAIATQTSKAPQPATSISVTLPPKREEIPEEEEEV